MNERRLEILKKIEQSELTVEEGFRLLGELDEQSGQMLADNSGQANFASSPKIEYSPSSESRSKVEVVVDKNRETMPDFAGWKVARWIIFALFLLLTAFSSVWMVQGWQRHPWGWGFWLSWIPFLIGLAGMAVIYNSHWLYLRIRNKSGEKPEKLTLGIPLPIGLVLWVFNTFGQWMPKEVHGIEIGEFLEEVDSNLSSDQPLIVQVDDESGEHVEIYIA